MDVFSRDDLAELVGKARTHTVSMFLPTHRAGPDVRPFAQEDRIRWKNLVREAAERLSSNGLESRGVDGLLEPARALVEDAEFWKHQGDGLAVFAADEFFRAYRVPLRLDELVVAGPRFHVRPLLALLGGDGLFYILALSQNAVRLIEATRDAASEVDVSGLVRSLDDALRYDDPEKQLQFRTATPRRSDGRRAAVFHGHGAGSDDSKDRVLRFCQQVDRGLAPVLRGRSAPLVVAAADPVGGIYRQANSYPHLVDRIVPGNPETLSARDLHARAWEVVEPHMRRDREAAAARYREARGADRTSTDLTEALTAAIDGRVDVLFVPGGIRRWGTFDPATRQTARHEEPRVGDEDLLNTAAVHTILGGGAVYTLAADEMPARADVAALLRY